MGRRRRGITVPLAAAAAVLIGVLVSGCGSGGPADQVQNSLAQFVSAVRHHDVSAGCREVTPAFWSGFAEDINSHLARTGSSITTGSCTRGLHQLFALEGNSPAASSGLSLVDVAVHGNSATGRQEVAGVVGGPMKFVRRDGRWLIACCAGRQLDQQPQSTYQVPSPSMLPTLHIDQRVVSDNAALRAHPPPLGAIVAFHPPAGADPQTPRCGAPKEGAGFPQACGRPTPQESDQTFIKRVVGLPGDRISIINGNVIRNGRPEERSYKVEPCGNGPACTFPDPITIPEGEYFVLGDNLGESDDSRFWGPVKRSWLIGIVKTP